MYIWIHTNPKPTTSLGTEELLSDFLQGVQQEHGFMISAVGNRSML